MRRVADCGLDRYDVRPLPRKALRAYLHATAGFRLRKRSRDCPGYDVIVLSPPPGAGLPPSVHCTCPSHQYRAAGTLQPCKHVIGLALADLIHLGPGTYCVPELTIATEASPCN